MVRGSELAALANLPATCTALTAGTTCSSSSWRATRARSHASIFERTRPLQCPRSTSSWRRRGSNTRSGYRPDQVLQSRIGYLLTRPVGDLRTMCAGSMPNSAIRPEPGPSRGRLSPRSSGIPENFIPRRLHVTNMSRPAECAVAFYNKRGTREQWIKEGEGAIKWTRLVVPSVRRQCGAAPASCARLQPRQFPAHTGDAGADQGLVADDLEGQADLDRREGPQPWPLCHLPDGRGRHRTANVPGDFCGSSRSYGRSHHQR